MKKELIKLVPEIIELIKSKNNIILSSHVGPDGDSLGSQIVFYGYLKSLGKKVCIYNEGHIPHSFNSFDKVKLVENDPNRWHVPQPGFDLAIIFECTNLSRIGKVRNLINSEIAVINIDHHPDNENFGRYNLVDTSASSVGEMIYWMFKSIDYQIDREMAEYLYMAILTDTGRFHFSSTTSEAMSVASDLIKLGIDFKTITDNIYFNVSEARLKLTGEVLVAMELFYNGRVSILTLRQKDLNRYKLKFGDMEGLVEWSMKVEGVEVGALLKDMSEGYTKISLRSKDKFDVCSLARKFNGGGHFNASGCHIKDDLETSKSELLKAIGEQFKHDK